MSRTFFQSNVDHESSTTNHFSQTDEFSPQAEAILGHCGIPERGTALGIRTQYKDEEQARLQLLSHTVSGTKQTGE